MAPKRHVVLLLSDHMFRYSHQSCTQRPNSPYQYHYQRQLHQSRLSTTMQPSHCRSSLCLVRHHSNRKVTLVSARAVRACTFGCSRLPTICLALFSLFPLSTLDSTSTALAGAPATGFPLNTPLCTTHLKCDIQLWSSGRRFKVCHMYMRKAR